jgi:hypothetical protein
MFGINKSFENNLFYFNAQLDYTFSLYESS